MTNLNLTQLDANSEVFVLKGVKKNVALHLNNLIDEVKALIGKCQYRCELKYLSNQLWLDSIKYERHEALMQELSREIDDALRNGKFNHLAEKPEGGLLGL